MRRLAAHDLEDARLDLSEIEGLEDNLVKARAQDIRGQKAAGVRSDRDDRGRGEAWVGAKLLYRLDPSLARHLDIHQDEIGAVAGRGIDGLLAIASADDRVALSLEEQAEEHLHVHLIVGDQDSMRHGEKASVIADCDSWAIGAGSTRLARMRSDRRVGTRPGDWRADTTMTGSSYTTWSNRQLP